MVKTEQSSAGNRFRTPQLAKMNDLAIFSVRTETHRVGVAPDDAHAQHTFVEGERAVEIGNLQAHPAQMRRLGKTVTPRSDSLLVGCRRHLLCRHLRLHSVTSR